MSNGLLHPLSTPLIQRRWPALTALCRLLLFLGVVVARAQDIDEEYLHVYSLIQQADSLNESGKAAPALAKYREAQTAILTFQRAHPAWNASVLTFRANYVAQKIASLSEAAPAADASSGSGGVQVKLLEAGNEPRQKLRLQPKPGDKQTANLSIKASMTMKIGEMENPPMKLPAMSMTIEFTVKNVSPEGDISFELATTDVSVAEEEGSNPQVVSAMKTAMAGLKGMSGSGTVSSRGISKRAEMKIPSDANAQVKQSMEQMKESLTQLFDPFPEEPAGPGAKWQVNKTTKSEGMTINESQVYEIVSIEEQKVSTKLIVTQTAPNQKISSPAMPGKLDLTKMNGKGSGEVMFDLNKLVPTEATENSHSDYSMTMNAGGQKQTITMSREINLHAEAK